MQRTEQAITLQREQAAEALGAALVTSILDTRPNGTREEHEHLCDTLVVIFLKEGSELAAAATEGLNRREGARYLRQITRRELVRVIGSEPSRPNRYQPRASAPIGGAS